MGRPPALTPAQQKEASQRRARGATLDDHSPRDARRMTTDFLPFTTGLPAPARRDINRGRHHLWRPPGKSIGE
jgi:hypothetical protein